MILIFTNVDVCVYDVFQVNVDVDGGKKDELDERRPPPVEQIKRVKKRN